MKTAIVLGLGFGDEGKGLTTDYLCRQSNKPLVVRFSGGHQAGHTVVLPDGKRHVFSSIGSGAFQEAPSYWSKYCTFYPTAFLREWEALAKLGIRTLVYVDALSMVTTPFDVFFNRLKEKSNQHGSCGVGFGMTVSRNNTPYKLYVQDLFHPKVLTQKLRAIGNYYEQKGRGLFAASDLDDKIEAFKAQIPKILPLIKMVNEADFFQKLDYPNIIFEGSQGILLDMDHGFFPNVTHASTTSHNAMKLIDTYNLPMPDIYYITRAYQTRHGNGYLSNENMLPKIIPNPKETNVHNEWQGHQRLSILDIDMLNYALACDANYAKARQKHLVITCLDQLSGDLQATKGKAVFTYSSAASLAAALPAIDGQVLGSYSDCGQKVGEISYFCGKTSPHEHSKKIEVAQ
jgi:adenylosuccinate synthase